MFEGLVTLFWSWWGRFCHRARQHTSAALSLRLYLSREAAAIFEVLSMLLNLIPQPRFEVPVTLGGGVVAFATEPGSAQRGHSAVLCYAKRPHSFSRAPFAC